MVAVIGVAGRHAVLLGLSVAEDEEQVGCSFLPLDACWNSTPPQVGRLVEASFQGFKGSPLARECIHSMTCLFVEIALVPFLCICVAL